MAKLNMVNMEKYLQSYDVLKQRYFWDMDSIPASLMKHIVSLGKNRKSVNKAWNFEKAQDAYLTVQKVYDDETKNHLGILQITFEKFIGDLVGIEGVDQLFESSYFYFEWMMHLEYSMDRHDYINYRDHYIHQIKNMYEMLVLLDDYGYIEYCIKAYKSNSNFIATQLRASIDKQMNDSQEADFFNKLTKYKNGNKSSSEALKRRQEYYYRYLIHSVSVIAALTHDIGYPVTYMLRTTKNLHSFLPISEAFIHLNDAMPHLEEILQSSLLYQTVDAKEIAKRITDDRDHGAISAVILLSKYYETGAIYHLTPIEKMVIELSAVVVYNHTLKYGYMTGNKELRYRNLFEENPISYLFRLCDDIQEWGRVYFDVSKRSNFLTCPQCHMPINRDNRNKKRLVHMSYSCACGISGVRRTQFPYRKLTNISACDNLEIKKLNSSVGGRRRIKIEMEYNLVSLLQLSVYNPRFAKQRADSLYEIKRMLRGQKEIPDVYIDTFLSSNPITIKVKCLERYLEYMQNGKISISRDVWRKKDLLIINNSRNRKEEEKYILQRMKVLLSRWDKGAFFPVASEVIRHVCEKEGWPYDNMETLWANIKEKWEQNLNFYYFLSAIGANIDQFRANGFLRERDNSIKFAKQLSMDVAQCCNVRDNIIMDLMMDYFWQRIRHVTEEEFFDHDEEIQRYYEEEFLSNQSLVFTVEDYVESEAYDRIKMELHKSNCKNMEGTYDFYSDYELFSAMAQCQ